MTPEKRTFFREKGYVFLERAVPQAHWKPVRDRIASELGRLGVSRSGRGLPRSIGDLPVFQQIGKLSGLLDIPDLAETVLSANLVATIGSLAGTKPLSRQSQLLVSPPNQGIWRLDGLNWHTDVAASKKSLPGIQAFVLLDDVASRGGATLLLSGSHLLAKNPGANARVREALRRGESETILREENLSIVELSGKAGDVYLMDMRVLHSPSVNATSRFRMVATVRYFFE